MSTGPQKGKLIRLLTETYAALLLEQVVCDYTRTMPSVARNKARAIKNVQRYLEKHGFIQPKELA